MSKDDKKYSRRGWLRAVGATLAGAAIAPAVGALSAEAQHRHHGAGAPRAASIPPSTALGLTKLLAKALELLRTGHNSAHRADVLSESRKVPQPARCRSENNAC